MSPTHAPPARGYLRRPPVLRPPVLVLRRRERVREGQGERERVRESQREGERERVSERGRETRGEWPKGATRNSAEVAPSWWWRLTADWCRPRAKTCVRRPHTVPRDRGPVCHVRGES